MKKTSPDMELDCRRDVARATKIVTNAQRALRRELTNGERRDLLADNTEWTTAYIAIVVGHLGDCE